MKNFSTVWLQDLVHRYSQGLMSEIEFVLQLQVEPHVVDAMLTVQKLPYNAAGKIEVSDLLHDDPRLEISFKEKDSKDAPSIISDYLSLVKRKIRSSNVDLKDGDERKLIKLHVCHDFSDRLGFEFIESADWRQVFIRITKGQHEGSHVIWVHRNRLKSLDMPVPPILYKTLAA